jgi:hypothetical protein
MNKLRLALLLIFTIEIPGYLKRGAMAVEPLFPPL